MSALMIPEILYRDLDGAVGERKLRSWMMRSLDDAADLRPYAPGNLIYCDLCPWREAGAPSFAIVSHVLGESRHSVGSPEFQLRANRLPWFALAAALPGNYQQRMDVFVDRLRALSSEWIVFEQYRYFVRGETLGFRALLNQVLEGALAGWSEGRAIDSPSELRDLASRIAEAGEHDVIRAACKAAMLLTSDDRHVDAEIRRIVGTHGPDVLASCSLWLLSLRFPKTDDR